MRKERIFWAAVALAACLLTAALCDALSLAPTYQSALVRIVSIQDNPRWGFMGEDRRTLVEWSDGMRTYVPGEMGEPGDAILASRIAGTESLFGWAGDHRMACNRKGEK